jgi:hypothetical protein
MGLTTAGTAHASTGTGASPAIRPVACDTPGFWLKLWGSLGPTCYRDQGVIIVNLPGVYREKIVGFHDVCLRTVSSVQCARGPATLLHEPPIAVREITMTYP